MKSAEQILHFLEGYKRELEKHRPIRTRQHRSIEWECITYGREERAILVDSLITYIKEESK